MHRPPLVTVRRRNNNKQMKASQRPQKFKIAENKYLWNRFYLPLTAAMFFKTTVAIFF